MILRVLGISALVAGGLAIAIAVFLVVVLVGPLIFWLAWNVLDFAEAVGLPELGFWGIVLATLFLVAGWGGKVLIAGIVFLVDPSWFDGLRPGALARTDLPQLRCGRPARAARLAATHPCPRTHALLATVPLQNRVTPLGDADRRPGAWARLRQPRVPARFAPNHRASIPGQALDRLQARVQGSSPRREAAAGALHGALLPRRSDRLRRRSPAVRRVPPRRLQPLPGDRRRDACRRSRRALARGAARASSRAARRGSCPTVRSCSASGEPWLVHGAELLRWTPAGYTERRPRSSGRLPVVTPPTLVEVLRAGWGGGSVPFLHPSAG